MSLNSRLRTLRLIRGNRATPLTGAAAALAAVTLAALPASAQYITVYGGPTTQTGGGPGGGVNDAGTSIGTLLPSGGQGAYRPVRWGASGTTELGNLGTDPSGYSAGTPYAINNAGTVRVASRASPQPTAGQGWDR